jgi:hypothetical protein
MAASMTTKRASRHPDAIRAALESSGRDVRFTAYGFGVVWDENIIEDDDSSIGALMLVNPDGKMIDGPFDSQADAIATCRAIAADLETEDLQDEIAYRVHELTNLDALRAIRELIEV